MGGPNWPFRCLDPKKWYVWQRATTDLYDEKKNITLLSGAPTDLLDA